ncbi:MAG: UvrD-helicase domain-containing protein [Thermodesulfobacteriota bacterium]
MFIADFHIHSRFSRATARNLNLPVLDWWAGRKGLALIGTGDFTHPAWLAELESQLLEAEEGLYRLKAQSVLPGGGQTRFVLSGEISSIYKKDGRVRKVHSLILMPSLAGVRRLVERLSRLGNLAADGRPILGLDARDLLAVCLDAAPDSFFIPAHIWTPWFSLLGSKSGFDSVEECFGDLASEIKALETGLSSDPPMNWRLSSLNPYVLISNSDAHSPEKLGREANIFQVDPTYRSVVRAMSGQGGFGGTIEFFPEEGKYHWDGHRKCGLKMNPEETRSLNGLCPACGRHLTVGVLSRVLELADRPAGHKPETASPFHSLIPLAEVLGEVLETGPQSKRVLETYESLLRDLGPELVILLETPLSDLAKDGGDVLAEAISRMRSSRVLAEAGYDGEFGRIKLFQPGEKEKLAGQKELFSAAPLSGPKRKAASDLQPLSRPAADKAKDGPPAPLLALSDPLLDDLNPEQKTAVASPPGQLIVIAGPGTGKTLVLTRRAAWLIREGLAKPEEILGVTFTRQAAGEMSARLAGCLPFRPELKNMTVLTFHALGLRILAEARGGGLKVLAEEDRLNVAKEAARGSSLRPQELLERISLAKQKLGTASAAEDPELARGYSRYQDILAGLEAVDFDDLVAGAVERLTSNPKELDRWRGRFPWLLVDEYQDINRAQYRLTRLLSGESKPNLTVIGDPDQAIYGFRGAEASYFEQFPRDFPEARTIRLVRNYRSTEAIIRGAGQVISRNSGPDRDPLLAGRSGPARITTAILASPRAEAEYVVRQIERLLGGTSHFALNSGRAAVRPETGSREELGLKDMAVLYRLHALARPMVEALEQAGLPYQQAGREEGRETDALDFKAEKINLLTMHAAKGLEFEVVFAIGLEEGFLPYHPPDKPPADRAEERRLFYVAMTRAGRHLFLTRSRTRTLFGRRLRAAPSPFLAEIAGALKVEDQLPARGLKPKNRQFSLF